MGGPGSELFAFAVCSVILGPIVAMYPEAVATYSERRDAVGSKRDTDGVEPTRRRVVYTKYIGIGLTVLGAAMLVGLTRL